jgi:hypothetical protein
MSHIRFIHVEGIFSDRLIDYTRARLLKETSKEPTQEEMTPKQIAILVYHEWNALKKREKGLQKKLDIKQDEIKTFYEKRNHLTAEELKRLGEIGEKILSYKEQNKTQSDEEVIENARAHEKRHPYVRYHTGKDWLPL